MATVDQFIRKLERLADTLPEIVLNSVDTAAGDAIDLVTNRLQKKGTDSTGNAWRPYSEEYQKRKKKDGKDVGYVNFTNSARMLNNIAVVDTRTESGKAVAIIAPKGEENRKKLDGNINGNPSKGIEGRGDILALSKSEIALTGDTLKNEFIRRVNKVLK